MPISGWRAALIVVGALIVLALLMAAVFWLAVAVAVLLAVAWFNLFLLPRIAYRVHVHLVLLAVVLAIVLGGGGYLLGGITGAVEGALIWLLGVAAPRVALWRLRRRVRLRRAPLHLA